MEYIQIAYQKDINDEVKNQIDTLERIAWLNAGVDEDDMLQFLSWKDDVLVAHVGIVLKTITLHDKVFTVAGICGVITHPKYRKKKYAQILLRQCTAYMLQEHVDFSIFTCHKDLVSFYTKAGWEEMQTELIGGTRDKPMYSRSYQLRTMMNCFSQRAKSSTFLRQENVQIEIGENKLW